LVKLIHPHGDLEKEDLRELLEFAMEGRRRVKEQLKKMGAFEFFQTSFSYIDKNSGEERFVGLPEEGARNVISGDPLEPGSVYAASVDDQGRVGLNRLEVGCAAGTGKLKLAGGIDAAMKESIQRAFGYLKANKVKLGIASGFDLTDFHVEAIDLMQNRVLCECGMALIVAVISAVKRVQCSRPL
jgi:ATP-dependent Lon protease